MSPRANNLNFAPPLQISLLLKILWTPKLVQRMLKAIVLVALLDFDRTNFLIIDFT